MFIVISFIYIHTYIHDDYGLTSYTTHIVCVNLIREWRNVFMAGLFTLRVFASNLLSNISLVILDTESIFEDLRLRRRFNIVSF